MHAPSSQAASGSASTTTTGSTSADVELGRGQYSHFEEDDFNDVMHAPSQTAAPSSAASDHDRGLYTRFENEDSDDHDVALARPDDDVVPAPSVSAASVSAPADVELGRAAQYSRFENQDSNDVSSYELTSPSTTAVVFTPSTAQLTGASTSSGSYAARKLGLLRLPAAPTPTTSSVPVESEEEVSQNDSHSHGGKHGHSHGHHGHSHGDCTTCVKQRNTKVLVGALAFIIAFVGVIYALSTITPSVRQHTHAYGLWLYIHYYY